MTPQTVTSIHRHQPQRKGPHTVVNISATRVDATGTRRRLRALAAIGYSQHIIATHSGVKTHYIRDALYDDTITVDVDVAKAIVKTYRALSTQLGPVDSTRTYARQHGWPPPHAWKDVAINDPASKPRPWQHVDLVEYYANPTDVQIAVERVLKERDVAVGKAEAILAARRLARMGVPQHQICRRLPVGEREARAIMSEASQMRRRAA